MGRERLLKLAPCIFGRYYDSGKKAIQVHFTFRGVRCRETMNGLDPDSRNHVKYAGNLLASIRRDIDRHTFNYIDYFPESRRARLFGHAVSNRTVKDVAESWLTDMKRSLPHSTYRSYEGPYNRFIYPAIGDIRIRDVSVEHIRQMFRGADISLKTARNYSIPLRAIFDRALDDDDINRNPMDRIKIKTLIPGNRHKTSYEVDPLNEKEIASVLVACEKYRPEWHNYFAFAIYTGLRTSELYGLHWGDINWKARSVTIKRAVVERRLKLPKTEASFRTIELCDVALSALKRQRANTELMGDEVFRNPLTGEPITDYESTAEVFDYCQRKAKIRRRNQYQTRHTYASNLLSQGENPWFVSKQLGHTNVQMLFRVYAKWIGNGGSSEVRFGKETAEKCHADVTRKV